MIKKLLIAFSVSGLTLAGVSFSPVSLNLLEWPVTNARTPTVEPATSAGDPKPQPYLGIPKEMIENIQFPPCAYTNYSKVVVEKTVVARLVEYWKDNHDLLESVRQAFHLEQHPGDLSDDPGLVLLRYEDIGEGIRLEFAHRRPVDRKIEHANRVCSSATHREERLPGLIVGLTCENAREQLSERIESTVAATHAERYWLHFEYALDYQKLELSFVETLCIRKGA